MKYTVEPIIFEKNPEIVFAVIIGKNLKNKETDQSISDTLSKAEAYVTASINPSLKEDPRIKVYRDSLRNVEINPNKFTNSVEAMCKRVLKASHIPRINALVDICNTIALNHIISLGGHDLDDINEDLYVRYSKDKDLFLPFGSEDFEHVEPGEVVFTSGHIIQTRKWLWRQSELGKMKNESSNVFFQLVGFTSHKKALVDAVETLQEEITSTFKGTYETYMVTKEMNCIEFNK